MKNLTEDEKHNLEYVQNQIADANFFKTFPTRYLSDGYHTYDELYDFRKIYNAVLFNEWARAYPEITAIAYKNDPANAWKTTKYCVHKSRRHSDGEKCFGGDWFIVSAKLPTGLISNHYRMEDWDLFQIPEVDQAKYEYDGHTSQDVLQRLKDLI